MLGGKARFGDAVHEALLLQPVGDELRHGDEGDVVLLRECLELLTAGRRAIVVEDLADDARRLQAGEARARSTAASVCPTRCSTPPARARSGLITPWPPCRRSERQSRRIDRNADGRPRGPAR